jgi:DnaK suppressor protein
VGAAVNKTILRAFRKVLELKRNELNIENGNRQAMTVENSADESDRIQHSTDRDCAMSQMQRTSDQLREVQAAICRVDADAFGVCAGCEQPINSRRLAAVPWTSCCLACQEIADADQAGRSGDFVSAA